MMDRIIGAFTFRSGVYSEVEHDTTWTGSAWLLVAVVSFLNALGANAGAGGFGNWIIGSIVGTIFAIIGFAASAFVINWVGKALFSADVSFEEMVRTLGLASVWRIIGFVGILALIAPALVCVLAPATIAAAILGLVAWFVATHEALDLGWGQTIVTVIIGWVVLLIVSAISGAILAALGLAAGAATGLLGG